MTENACDGCGEHLGPFAGAFCHDCAVEFEESRAYDDDRDDR